MICDLHAIATILHHDLVVRDHGVRFQVVSRSPDDARAILRKLPRGPEREVRVVDVRGYWPVTDGVG